MTKTLSFFLLLLIAFTLIQCKKKSKAVATNNNMTMVDGEAPGIAQPMGGAIIVDPAFSEPERNDPFQILGVRVENDSLKVQVQYGGGCEEHKFTMFTNLMWAKSMPPRLELTLVHFSNNDRCRALLTKTLTFALDNIHYQGQNKVRLIVNKDIEHIVEYSY